MNRKILTDFYKIGICLFLGFLSILLAVYLVGLIFRELSIDLQVDLPLRYFVVGFLTFLGGLLAIPIHKLLWGNKK